MKFNTSSMHLYKLDGQTPVLCHDLTDWAETMKHNRHVKDEQIGDTRISTVFLGLDHNHSWQGGPPILFETLVFAKNGLSEDDWMERCSTWEEAEKMHQRMVDQVRSSQDEPGTV